MFFNYTSNQTLLKEQLQTNLFQTARTIITYYKYGATELALDQYFIKTFKCSLKSMCFKLLANLQGCQLSNNEVIYTFKNPDYDKIARFITYGDGITPGSKILLRAFQIL